MEIESWKDNLLSYVNKMDEISNKYLLNAISKDKTLFDCIIDFFNTDNLQDIVILYDEHSWIFAPSLNSRHIICCPYLEGKPINIIEWETSSLNLPTDSTIQLSYLILDDIIDPLYEFRLISKEYNINYDINRLQIKCLVDNRTTEYKKPHHLSIENRSGLVVFPVVTKQS